LRFEIKPGLAVFRKTRFFYAMMHINILPEHAMSPIVVRLLLAGICIASVPAVWVMVLIILFAVLDDVRWGAGWMVASSLACLLTASYLVSAWITIWWPVVHWTGRRIRNTVIVTAGAVVGACIFAGGFVVWSVEAGPLSGGISWALLWLTGVTLAWAETSADRTAKVRAARGIPCPRCRYNLTGLKQSICPECGASFTLDELFASLKEEKGTLPEETRV
jgi:hypothetical protein